MALSDYSHIRDYAQAGLIEYIEQTQGLATTANETICYDDQPICHISKLHNRRNIIRARFTDAVWAKSPEVASKVCTLLQVAVMKKKEKFLTKGKLEPSILSFPRILLVLNTYAFADPAMYSNCINLIPSLDFFHSVLVVWHDTSCSLIFTTDEAWSRAPRHSET